MGCACFRRHGHSRPAGGAGGPDPRRRRPNNDLVEPNAAATDADPELPASGHPVGVGNREPRLDAHPNAKALGLRVSQPVGHGGRERVGDSMPVTQPDGVRLTERQPQGIRLPVG